MSFLNKLGEVAKSVGEKAKEATEKAGDMIEVKKLESKINGQNDQIYKLKAEIGDIYWNKYASGEQIDFTASEVCGRIQQAAGEIEVIKEQIAQIKADNNKPQAQQPQSQQAQPQAVPMPIGIGRFCTGCGTQLDADLKFCSNCGMKLE